VSELRLIASEESSRRENRRAYARIPFPYPVSSQVGGQFEVRDFSPGGVGIVSSERLEDQHFVKFAIDVPGMPGPVPFTCEILWHKELPRTGEHFAGTRFIDQGLNRAITKYLYSAIRDQEKETLTLTPLTLASQSELTDRIVTDIQNVKLPPFFEELVQRARPLSRRPAYIWKWCYQAMKSTTLPCVNETYSQILDNTKMINFMFTFLLDDLADEKKEPLLLREYLKMVVLKQPLDFEKIPAAHREEADFLTHLWSIVQSNVRQLPRYEEFKDLIQYDLEQSISSLQYAYLSNTMFNILNEQEAMLYEGNNINVILNGMLDITCSPDFRTDMLGALREALCHAQMMCKISNWLSTWEREVKVSDWTSGVIAAAMSEGIIEKSDLANEDKFSIIRKINHSLVPERLMRQWDWHRNRFIQKLTHFESIDLKSYLKALDQFLKIEMALKVLY